MSIVITHALRTPIGNFGGYYKNTPAPKLGAAVLKALMDQSQLPGETVEQVIMGCVLPAGLGQAPARQAAIKAGLPNSCGALTVNKMCGSGMATVMLAHDSLAAGSYQVIIAGGMENMSMAPYLLPKARFGYRLGHNTLYDHMMLDGLEDAYNPGQSMGVFAEQCAEKFNFTREQQDTFALNSVERAQQADFSEEITPVQIKERKQTLTIEQDEGPLTIKKDKIPELRPAFKKEGTVTAANASSISDGAAALLMMSEETATQHGLTPLAKIIGHATYAQAPEWFTTAPVGAIKKLMQKINWEIGQIDLFEINEAFAVVTMAAMEELSIPHEKVNIHGGACVLGHPIGASGARILTTLIHTLKQKGLKRGVAALCIGGGEATAIAIEVSS